MKSSTNTDESENPLDVLSRAATMVEKSDLKVERSPSFKERHPKFRKSSTPDYMVALEAARSLKRQTSLQSDQSESRMDASPSPNNNTAEDLPLDMSIKKRPASPPPPPPYRFNPLRSTTPPSSHFRPPPQYSASTPSPPLVRPPPPSYEDSKVTCTYPTKTTPPPRILQEVPEEKTKIKEITIITNSSADPLLDEHFRRSLGADYESLFKKKTGSESEPPSSTESTPPKVPQQQQSSSDQSPKPQEDSTKVDDPVKAFQEDMEMEGYTVEDHFAKALGDTWVKLQKAEEEKRSSAKKSDQTETKKPTLVKASS